MRNASVFCAIMHHEGEILDKLLDELGIKKGKLAELMGVHRNTVTVLIQSQTVPIERLLQVQEAVRFDISSYFPKLNKVNQTSIKPVPESPSAINYKKAYDDCQKELNDLRAEYIRVVRERDALRNRQTG